MNLEEQPQSPALKLSRTHPAGPPEKDPALVARKTTRKYLHRIFTDDQDFLSLADDANISQWLDTKDPDGEIGREFFEREFESFFGRDFKYKNQ